MTAKLPQNAKLVLASAHVIKHFQHERIKGTKCVVMLLKLWCQNTLGVFPLEILHLCCIDRGSKVEIPF